LGIINADKEQKKNIGTYFAIRSVSHFWLIDFFYVSFLFAIFIQKWGLAH